MLVSWGKECSVSRIYRLQALISSAGLGDGISQYCSYGFYLLLPDSQDVPD